MSVLVSNPERKKERTDQDANNREVYVAGLSKFTTKTDLEKLFKTVRGIQSARLLNLCPPNIVWQPKGGKNGHR